MVEAASMNELPNDTVPQRSRSGEAAAGAVWKGSGRAEGRAGAQEDYIDFRSL